MSQLLPAALLALALISPTYAIEPYESICTSELDYQTEEIMGYRCDGTDATACTKADGEYDVDNSECKGIDTETSAKCDEIPGFSYKSYNCGDTGTFLNNPDNAAVLDCSNPFIDLTLNHFQSTCCGGTSNHKDVCPNNPDPHEAICTSQEDFQSDVVMSFDCIGYNATACTDAGGKYNKDEAKCYDINTDTPDECNEIAEFTYTPGQTCEEFVNFLAIPSFFRTSFSDIYLNCSSPIAYIVIPEIQSTCCGGMNNHKDICGSPPVHEAICTSEQDFQTNATGVYACEGNNSTACETAGGKYDENELICEGIGIANPAECDQITGFNSEPRETCGEFGLAVYIAMSDISSNVCADPAFLTVVPQVQSNCCGGVNNHKDVCPGIAKPYEAVCTSEEYFEAKEIVGYSCYGTNATACTDAGGEYDNFECNDIDECEEIAGFADKPYTCEDAGTYLSDPQVASEFLNCTAPYSITQLQFTCCGGTFNNKNICPDAPIITPADVCNKCDDENFTEDGVSDECFNTVTALSSGGWEIAGADFCPDEPESGSEINVACKTAVYSGFGCLDPLPTSAPTSATGEKSSASDISNVLAVMIPTALFLCWTHL